MSLARTVSALLDAQRAMQGACSTFSGDVLKGLRLVELDLKNVDLDESSGNLKPMKHKAGAKLTLEIEVTQAMCNLHSMLHGGCAAFLLDCEDAYCSGYILRMTSSKVAFPQSYHLYPS